MIKKKWFARTAVVLLAAGTLAACGGTKADSDSAEADSNDKEQNQSGSITAVGSSALQPLVEAAAQQYASANPGATINIQGGGSGTGLSKISEGAVDIGNSDIFAEEKEGVDASGLVDHKVAVVGMGPVVHPDAAVENVSTDELIGIFTGEIKNWKELGGNDQDIIVINRAKGSGTRATFESTALQGNEPIESQEQDSSGTVRKIVSETPGSISYLAFSYFDDSIVALQVDGAEPTREQVETNDWKIWAYQHMYTKGEPSGLTKEFIDYMMSNEVQEQLLPEMDYLPVTGMKVERDAAGNITNK